jgi:hypothetical protein
VIGGLLLERFEWNAVFFVNLPVVALAVAGGAVYLAESKDESAPKTDIPGVILSITGLFALVYGIIEAGELGWTDSQVLTSFGIAAVLLTAFAIWEARNPDAMLPMHFFKNMSFTGANVAMVLVMFSLFGSIFFLSQYMQSVLGYSALGAGLRLLPLALTLMVVAANSATIAERIGTKFTVATGIAITGTSLLIMSRAYEVDSGYGVILGTIVLFAVGMGLTFSPATNSIMQSVPVSKAGIGSAMNDTTRQLGGALGVAVLGTIMNDVYLDRIGDIDEILPQLPAPVHEAIASSIQGAHIAAANPTVPDAARETIINMANGAFVNGMNDAMLIGAIIMYAASVLTLLILPSRVRRPQEEIERETMQRQAETVAAPLVSGD